MKALSVKQPWAEAILSLGKDIENRNWRTTLRETIAIHASLGISKGDVDAFSMFVSDILKTETISEIRDRFYDKTLPLGVIVGTVDIVDCVEEHDSPWFCGPYGFVLENPRRLVNPIEIRGSLGFWEVPDKLVKTLAFV